MKTYIHILLMFLVIGLGAVACNETNHDGHTADKKSNLTYTCPMHPQVVQHEPGTCPICGMDLVPVSKGGDMEGRLMLSESQIALGNIKTMQASLGNAANSTLLTGKLVLDETQTEVVSSRATGRVERLYIKETGQTIRKGQPLYELYSEELLSLQREYLLALEQNRELGEQEPRFASFLEAARKKLLLYGLTEGQISQLAKSKNLESRITFFSPASGIVTDIAATEGQYVPEGGVLYRLGDLSKIWVEAELYPREVQQVKAGDAVQVVVQGFGSQAVPARVSFISPELRQGSQVVVLRAELPNRDGQFLPGMQANVLLPRGGSSVITLPNDAVVREQQGSHIWVHTGEGTFEARPVTLGEASFDSVAVVSGVQPGDQVVSSGAYLLYSEYVLKKGGNPLAGTAVARAIDLEQTPIEAYVEADVVDFQGQVPEAFKQQLVPVLDAYLRLKNALIAAETDAAAAASKSLIQALEKTNSASLKGDASTFWLEKKQFLLQHARESLEAKSIEAKRKNFIFLSQPMIKIAEAFGAPGTLYVQFCPMANNDKGAYWLSAEDEIRNPYYGSAMLTCGEVVKPL